MLTALGIGKENIQEVYTVPFVKLRWAYRQVARRLFDEGRYVIFEPEITDNFIGFPPFNGFAPCSNQKPLIISSVLGEFAACPLSPEEKEAMSEADKVAFLHRTFGDVADELIARFRSAYPNHDILDLTATDTVFRQPAIDAAYEKAASGSGNTYLCMASPNTLENGRTPLWHGGEVGYAFRNTDRVFVLCDPENGERLTNIFSSILLNYARTGDPNNEYLPHWEPFTAENPCTMVIDSDCELRMARDENGKAQTFDQALQTLLCSVTPPFKLPPMFAEGANDAQIGMDR